MLTLLVNDLLNSHKVILCIWRILLLKEREYDKCFVLQPLKVNIFYASVEKGLNLNNIL